MLTVDLPSGERLAGAEEEVCIIQNTLLLLSHTPFLSRFKPFKTITVHLGNGTMESENLRGVKVYFLCPNEGATMSCWAYHLLVKNTG